MSRSTSASTTDVFELSDGHSSIEGLTPAQTDRLTEILDQYFSALEKGVPPAREELLAAHPDLAGRLKAYLDRLVELHDAAAGFDGVADCDKRPAAPADEEKRLGDFCLRREIGRGGMGVVYEARQISLGRRVALKVLPFAAVLDSRQIARFQHEAQAAAQLDHPNIVSVFAVGVDRGVHYYAMQFVDGQSLDRALAELRAAGSFHRTTPRETAADAALNTASASTVDNCPANPGSLLTAKSANQHEYCRTVVRLGIQAAEALQAAHEQGVVHRDIKPSNLLLDGSGKLWVTDFGLARCRSDATLTRTGDVVGTLRYMSPEQATGQSVLIDQRTDVYSLGITLYELLALQPALDGEDGPALLRQIEQQEPQRLRQLQPAVPADLETVVFKAIAKHREERYTTAREFADDLRRVLEGKPTAAKPPTVAERLQRWAHRHRRAVAVAAAVCLLATLGMAVSTLLIAREKARTEANFVLAEKHFRQAEDAVDRLGKELAERLSDVPGAAQVRKELLRDTLRYYASFAEQAKQDPALRADLALTYNKIGELNSQIGSNDEAIEAHQNAIRLFEKLAAGDPGRMEYRRGLAISQNELGLAQSRAGRIDDARRAYCDAIRLQERLLQDKGETIQYLADLAMSHSNLGLLQGQIGESANARASFREAIRRQEHALELGPHDPEVLRNLAASLNNLSALCVGEQPGEAADLCERALAYQSKAADLRPTDLQCKRDMAITHNNLGSVDSRRGQFSEAAAAFARAVEIQAELVRVAPALNSHRHDLAVSFNNLGTAQRRLQRTVAAEFSFRQALDLQKRLVQQNPRDLEWQSNLGGIYNNLAMLLEQRAEMAEAADNYRRAVEHQKIAWSQAPQVSRYREFLSNHYSNYARILRRLGNVDEAVQFALARKALWPNDPQHLYAVAEELALAAGSLIRSSRGEVTAQQCADIAVETLRQAKAAGWKPPADHDWSQSFAALKGRPGFAELVDK